MRPASLRIPLYIVLVSTAIFNSMDLLLLVLGLTATRLDYTLHIPKGDTLNGGVDFYDPIVAELLVCSLLSLGFAPFIFQLHDRFWTHPFPDVSSAIVEVIALVILWLLWLIGSAVASNIWPNLSFCYRYEACRVLAAMTAFAWLGWLTICALLAVNVYPLFQKKRGSAGPDMVEWAVPPASSSSSQV